MSYVRKTLLSSSSEWCPADFLGHCRGSTGWRSFFIIVYLNLNKIITHTMMHLNYIHIQWLKYLMFNLNSFPSMWLINFISCLRLLSLVCLVTRDRKLSGWSHTYIQLMMSNNITVKLWRKCAKKVMSGGTHRILHQVKNKDIISC